VKNHALDLRDRDALFAALESRVFDVAVIGGGITGAGVARDAAMRGLSVALVEACATSPRATWPWCPRLRPSARSSRPSPRTWRARRRS
jgi:glycine/D-amino acid oxidase-like deaminating enzyme